MCVALECHACGAVACFSNIPYARCGGSTLVPTGAPLHNTITTIGQHGQSQSGIGFIINTHTELVGLETPEQVEHLLLELPAAAAEMSPPEPPRHEPDVQNQTAATTALDQSNKVPPFPYEPLGRNQFRLLRFTGQANGQIRGELITAIFSRTKLYTCLSYTWGPPSTANSSSHVLINDYPFSVSPNLKSFLACYVVEKLVTTDDAADDKSMGAYFWIDQICIDQSSVSEKNAQVSRMDEVYRNAKGGTIVWLGDPRAESYLGKGLLDATWEITRDLVDRMTAESVRGSKDAHTICEEHMSSEDMEILGQIVSDMVSNTYWTRMWIVQEVLLSPKLRLMYGPHIFPYETIHAIGSFAYYRDSTNFTPPRVYDLWTDKQWFNAQEGMELARALKWIEGQCHDVRDKVFAVLGTVKADERALLRIDYAMPTEELFADVVRALIVTCIYHVNDSERILHWLGKYLGIPSALAPLSSEKREGSNKQDFTYINLMAARIKRSEIKIDLGKLSLVELIQFIYEHTKPTSQWYEDQDRKRVREWLEMQEKADVEELDQDVQDMGRLSGEH